MCDKRKQGLLYRLLSGGFGLLVQTVKSSRRQVIGVLILAVAGVLTWAAAAAFQAGRSDASDAWGPFHTAMPVEERKLSDWAPGLLGTAGDTGVFILRGPEPGGTALVLGGTHADEPAGVVAAVLLLETAQVRQGTLIIIPRANQSAATHGLPQEGHPAGFVIITADGERRFRVGARVTNPVHQGPDPEVYVEPTSRQELAGMEARNLNRAYPGRDDGNLTQRIAYAITNLIQTEGVDLAVDLHEASPEYPVVNAIVAHPRAMDLAAWSVIMLEMEGLSYNLEPSPEQLRGLSHREWGDNTDAFAVLMETANPVQGRLRGVTNEALIITGADPLYEQADAVGRLYAPYPEGGYSLDWRVARHVTGLKTLFSTMGDLDPEQALHVSGVPSYEEIVTLGVGAYLGKEAP
jgi:hypothetical protein